MHIPDIIAHRGSSRECLENTIAAFQRALDEGADGIELDVHGTKDGQVVVHHDPFVTDFADINDSGFTAKKAISTMSLAELQCIKLADGQAMPLLSDVFDLVSSRATVYVEVKAPRIENEVASVLGHYAHVRAAVHSFDHRIPVAVRALRASTQIGILSDIYPIDLHALFMPGSPDVLWQYAPMIDEGFMRTADACGVRVIAWTENDPVHARLLASWGVSGLCTDTPALMRAAFSRND